MGKLLFKGKTFTKSEESILLKAFNFACERLKIADMAFLVSATKEAYDPSPRHYARVAQPFPKLFVMEMNSTGFNLFDASSALMHECVHMKQYLTGELHEDEDGAVWKGNFVPHSIAENMLFYDFLPWEKEAWKDQGKHHIQFVNSLSPDEQKLVRISDSHGLHELWDEKPKQAAA